MHLALRQNSSDLKSSYFAKTKPIAKPRCSTQDKFQEECQEQQQFSDQEDAFNMTITDRRPEEMGRAIKKSVVNRSCINTLNYNCRDLLGIPPELSEHSIQKLSQVQKIDLSFNNISDIHGILFSKMNSLKELLLNDNSISELPFSEMNQCRGLKLVNVNNNKLYILPPLTRPSFLEARMNPLRLVTSELVRLNQIEFVTFDWLEYLIEGGNYSGEDRYKEYAALYSRFKKNILQKIDYEHQDNSTYCDFHSYFSIRMVQALKKQKSDSFLSLLIVKSMHRNDHFFINYLRNYQNELNYPKMIYSCKLLLQMALQNSNESVLELFRLKKSNYSYGVSEQIYYESLKLACRYSHYEMFEFLMSIRNQKKKMQTKERMNVLVSEVFERFDRDKDSHKILHSLVSLYKDVDDSKILIKIPEEFNSKAFKALSMAILEIHQNKDLQPYFAIENEESRSSPLHFAMKSRNEQLLKELLEGQWDVFTRSHNGTGCRYVYGSTQVSRKMVWKREKSMIKRHWAQSKTAEPQSYPSNKCSRQSIDNSSSKIYIDLDNSFESFGKSFREPISSSRKMILSRTLGESQTKSMIQDKILPFLFVRAKEYVGLSWMKDYSKKLTSLNGFISYLVKLNVYREESLMKRLEIWKKISDKLTNIYQALDDEDPLLQYEIIMACEGVNGVREDRCVPCIKVQGQKASIESGGFWCCQNLTDDE